MHEMQMFSEHEPWIQFRPVPVDSEAESVQISDSVQEGIPPQQLGENYLPSSSWDSSAQD